MASMIGLPSDHVLPEDPECLPFIKVGRTAVGCIERPSPPSAHRHQEFAQDQGAFFDAFAAAYIKMTGFGVEWK